MYGIVKWFDFHKGYGFIYGQNSEEFFVHYSAISQEGFKSLEKGDLVQFESRFSRQGLQAMNVKCIHSLKD